MTLVSLDRNFNTTEANMHLHFVHNKFISLQPFKLEENIGRNHPFESGLDHVRKRGREIKIDDPFFLPSSALRSVEHPFHAAEWLYLSPLTPKGDWQHAAAHSPSIR